MLMTVLRRHLMVVGKSVVSLALLGLIVAQHDFSFLSAQRHRLNAITVMVCLGLLAIQITVVAGTRLKLVLETLGSTLGLARTTQVALCDNPTSAASAYAMSCAKRASESSRIRPLGAQSASPGRTGSVNRRPRSGAATSSLSCTPVTLRFLDEQPWIGGGDAVDAQALERGDRRALVHRPGI